MTIVNESSTAYMTVTFTDKLGVPAVPQTVSYWIHDQLTGQLVHPETAVDPAEAVEITLAPSDHALLSGRLLETRFVTIVATYGDDDQVTEETSYQVRNLLYLPS